MEYRLHCNKCGRKRSMKVGFLIEQPQVEPEVKEGEPVPEKKDEKVFAFVPVRVKSLLKNIQNKQIPQAYIGQCFTCFEKTFFEIRKINGKRSLVVVA